MLEEAGSRWDDWRRFDPATLGPERLHYYKSEITRLIEEEYGDAPIFVLEDPRLCRFVPFYKEILGEMGVEPRYILTYRNPVSVLDSLAARDDVPGSYASLVWLRHVLDAEEATRGKARVFLAYEEYLDDWRAVAAKVTSALRLDWPRTVNDVGQDNDPHLSRSLQYPAEEPSDPAADPRLGRAVRDVYWALLVLSVDDGDAVASETLSRVRAEFEYGQPLFEDARLEEIALRQNREQQHQEHLKKPVANLETQVARRELALVQLSEENTALERQIATLSDAAAIRAIEMGRLGSERKGSPGA